MPMGAGVVGGGTPLLAMQYAEGAAPMAAPRGYLIYPAPMDGGGAPLKLDASSAGFVAYPQWMAPPHKSDKGSSGQ